MGTKFDVRCGNWKTIIEASTQEELQAKIKTALLRIPECHCLGFFVVAKEARKRNETFRIICSTLDQFSN